MLFASSCVEWYISQYACFLTSLVVVPVHSSTSTSSLAHIFSICKPSCIITSKNLRHPVELAFHLSSASFKKTPLLVLINDCPDSYALRKEEEQDAQAMADEGVERPITLAFETVLRGGTVLKPRLPRDSSSGNDMVMLLPTSGTSGLPKLTIITNSMLLAQCRPPDFGVDLVMLSFEPLRQSLDVLAKGGSIGVYSGTLERLLVRDSLPLQDMLYGLIKGLY